MYHYFLFPISLQCEEMNSELDLRLHLHKPRARRAEYDVHNVRAGRFLPCLNKSLTFGHRKYYHAIDAVVKVTLRNITSYSDSSIKNLCHLLSKECTLSIGKLHQV